MPRTIALIYLAFGVLWIFLTDRLLVWLHFDSKRILHMKDHIRFDCFLESRLLYFETVGIWRKIRQVIFA